MSEQVNVGRPPIENWQVLLFRTTAFPTPSSELNIDDIRWWETLVGQQPEDRSLKPRQKVLIESGNYEAGSLTLRLEPGRIDWLFEVLQEDQHQSKTLLTLGNFTDLRDPFSELMSNWFNQSEFPPIYRIAFSPILILPVDSKVEGHRTLSSFLPRIEIDVDNSDSFLFQINRKRNSRTGIDNLRINRLSKWSVQTYRSVSIITGQDVSVRRFSQESYQCRLELDINTEAEYEGEFNSEQSSVLFQEMVDYAEEIAREGDIE